MLYRQDHSLVFGILAEHGGEGVVVRSPTVARCDAQRAEIRQAAAVHDLGLRGPGGQASGGTLFLSREPQRVTFQRSVCRSVCGVYMLSAEHDL